MKQPPHEEWVQTCQRVVDDLAVQIADAHQVPPSLATVLAAAAIYAARLDATDVTVQRLDRIKTRQHVPDVKAGQWEIVYAANRAAAAVLRTAVQDAGLSQLIGQSLHEKDASV